MGHGTDRTLVHSGCNILSPASWAPDGLSLVFTKDAGCITVDYDLYVWTLDTAYHTESTRCGPMGPTG